MCVSVCLEVKLEKVQAKNVHWIYVHRHTLLGVCLCVCVHLTKQHQKCVCSDEQVDKQTDGSKSMLINLYFN